jgi:riboflavin-specific deaminase-like protein
MTAVVGPGTPTPAGLPPIEGRIIAAVLGVLAMRRGPRMRRDPLPVVTLSWSQSAAGAIARKDGSPLRISGPESTTLTHRLRAAHDAILVGIQTVLNDDPLLSVRLLPGPPNPSQPQPVVLDSRLRFPLGARLLAREDRKPWIFHSRDAGAAGPAEAAAEKAAALVEKAARLFRVTRGPGGLDLYEVLQSLGAAGISSLMVEGGARVLRAFITAGFADQLVVTVSPSTVQGMPGPDMPGLVQSLTEACGADSVTWGTLNP